MEYFWIIFLRSISYAPYVPLPSKNKNRKVVPNSPFNRGYIFKHNNLQVTRLGTLFEKTNMAGRCTLSGLFEKWSPDWRVLANQQWIIMWVYLMRHLQSICLALTVAPAGAMFRHTLWAEVWVYLFGIVTYRHGQGFGTWVGMCRVPTPEPFLELPTRDRLPTKIGSGVGSRILEICW